MSPVAAGTGVAAYFASFDVVLAALALVVALAFQVGVNYANDYSDGVRGTDDVRVGPTAADGVRGRRTSVRSSAAAFVCFAVGAVAGLVIVALTAAVVVGARGCRVHRWRLGTTPAARHRTGTADSARSASSSSSAWLPPSAPSTSRPNGCRGSGCWWRPASAPRVRAAGGEQPP